MLQIILLVVSVALIIVCLLQTGKTEGIVNALTGQSSNLFAQQKERGIEITRAQGQLTTRNIILRFSNINQNGKLGHTCALFFLERK